MRIRAILERPVRLRGGPANAVVNFGSHTVSLVALVTDAIRNGKPVVGVAFDSIGRFAQSGILRERLIPRVLEAPPDTLLD
ncbi:MAG: mandelate racemase, partial [Mycobacterium sp.]